MKYKKSFGYLLLVITLVIVFTAVKNSKQAERDELLNSVIIIEEPVSFDIDRAEKAAKSPQGVRFVALTKMQRELFRTVIIRQLQMKEKLQFVEDFNWDSDNPKDWEILDFQLEILCPKLLENNSKNSELSKVLDEKIRLAKHPNVIAELFDGDAKNTSVVEQDRDNQKVLMDDSQEYYEAMCTSH